MLGVWLCLPLCIFQLKNSCVEFVKLDIEVCKTLLGELTHALNVVHWIVLVRETIFQKLVLSPSGDVGLAPSGGLICVYIYNVGDRTGFSDSVSVTRRRWILSWICVSLKTDLHKIPSNSVVLGKFNSDLYRSSGCLTPAFYNAENWLSLRFKIWFVIKTGAYQNINFIKIWNFYWKYFHLVCVGLIS